MKKISDEELNSIKDEFISMIKDGIPYKAIAKHFGRNSNNFVYDIANRLGVILAPRAGKTLEERKQIIVEESKKKWNNRYTLNLDNYENRDSIIKVTDKLSGITFEQSIKNHLRTGMPIQIDPMRSKYYSQEDFERIVKENFGDTIDISGVVYKGADEIVTVTCKLHNYTYSTRAYSLIHNHCGCPECYSKRLSDSSFKRKVNWEEPEIRQKLQDLVKSGKTFEEIGEEFGVTGHQVGVVVKGFGIEVPDRQKEKNDLVRDLINSGKSIEQTAEICGVSTTRIYQRAKILGLDYYKREVFDPTTVSKEFIINRLSSGETVISIARELEITRELLEKSINYYQISPQELREDFEKREYVPKIRELADSGMACFPISVELGLSFNKVKELAKLYDIQIPPGINFITSGELLISKYLEEMNIEFDQHVRIVDDKLFGRNTNLVIIDFVIPGQSIWIEYNGKQHYEYVPCFYDHEEKGFEKQLTRDENIRKYCKGAGIKLIEVPYTLDNYSSISDFLDQTIFEGIDPSSIINYESLYKLQ